MAVVNWSTHDIGCDGACGSSHIISPVERSLVVSQSDQHVPVAFSCNSISSVPMRPVHLCASTINML